MRHKQEYQVGHLLDKATPPPQRYDYLFMQNSAAVTGGYLSHDIGR